MEKYILLDRDGTINVEKDYLYKIEDFDYEEGVLEALEILKEKGYKFAVITNQSGIGRGYYTEEEFLELTDFLRNDLEKRGIIIEKTYYCPHHVDGIGKYKIENGDFSFLYNITNILIIISAHLYSLFKS